MVFNYYGLPDISSASSCDFGLLLPPAGSQLLAESLSIDSLSTTASNESIPPFPSTCAAPTFPMLLAKCSPMFPQDKDGISEPSTVTLTTLTPPRLQKVPNGPLSVNQWMSNVVSSPSQNLVPWTYIESKRVAWVPEGSICPRSEFSKAMSRARTRRRIKDNASTPTKLALAPLEGRYMSDHPSTFREALVFEREISLGRDSEKKRWSLQVPTTSMNPEMVNMVLELQDLNAFFKDSLDEVDQSAVVSGQEKRKIETPSLIVSDSHCALPLSLESSGNLIPDKTASLATRRGKNSLPPLSIKRNITDIAYPSIPSPFLGSPSAYSPKFEYANAPDDPSLDLEDMITNLRTQCASIQTQSQTAVYSQRSLHDKSPMPISLNNETEDWAFADSFLTTYNGRPVTPDLSRMNPLDSHRQTLQGASTRINTDVKMLNSDINVQSMLHSFHDNASTLPSNNIPSAPPPFTPLPPRPSLAGTGSPREVRGILKSCKNVRFASLPSRSKASIDLSTPARVPRYSIASSPVSPPRQSSRSRPTCNLKPGVNKENAPPLLVPHGNIVAPSRGPKSNIPGTIRPVSTPLSSHYENPPLMEKVDIADPIRPSPRPITQNRSTVPTKKINPVLLGRHSLKHVIKAEGDQRDESRARRMSSTSRPVGATRWTVNQLTFRQGSNANQHQDSGTSQSRMPVPLRNILTRFK